MPHAFEQTGDTATCSVCGHVASARVQISVVAGRQYLCTPSVHCPSICGGSPGAEPRWPTWDEIQTEITAALTGIDAGVGRRAQFDENASDAFAALSEVFGMLWRMEAWRLLRGWWSVVIGPTRIWIDAHKDGATLFTEQDIRGVGPDPTETVYPDRGAAVFAVMAQLEAEVLP